MIDKLRWAIIRAVVRYYQNKRARLAKGKGEE